MNFSLFSLLFFALFISPSPAAASYASPADSSLQQEKNKDVALRVFKEILNEGNFQVADEIYARDFINHGLRRNFTLDEDQAAARWEKKVAPDLTLTADVVAVEDDLVTVVWTARGTQTVGSGWLPATGVRIEERGITVWRIVDGKIRDEWTCFDQLGILRQAMSQLKWTLLGVVFGLILLVWLSASLVRNRWRNYKLRAHS